MGAGKSAALAALERLGAATVSSDEIVHELLAGDEVRDELLERLGPSVARGGRVDRKAVAEIVFKDDEKRKWLEGVLWPRVGQRIVEWREELESRNPPPRAAVVEVPLLFEAGMEGAFDATVAIVAPEHLRARRAHARKQSGLGGRASRQLSQKEKAEKADYVVRNDGSLRTLEEKLSELLATIGT
jgi:dephospho-CoA kinase